MKKITYNFSLDYNLNSVDNTVLEIRSIKRYIENDETDSVQILKADMKEHSLKDMDNQFIEWIIKEPFSLLSEEISEVQFKKFMDESFDIFSIDLISLNLN